MNWRQIVLVINVFMFTAGYSITHKFAKDYFDDRYVHRIVVFSCVDNDEIILPLLFALMVTTKKKESVNFLRSLMNLDTSVTYVPINDNLNMPKILKVDYYRLGIYVDWDCQRREIIFEQFAAQQLRYNESYWWLIVTERESLPTNFFAKQPLNIATEMTFAVRQNDSYELHDVYNPSYRHGGRLNVTFMGQWNSNDGLRIDLTQYKYKRRGNLHGMPLNLSIVIDHPPETDFMAYLTNPVDKHFDTMHRFNYGIMLQLSDFYNFTMNLKRGTTWGYKVNGSWNGILGDMVKGIVDISATPFNYRKDRLDVTDYTVQTWLIKIVSIFRHPQRNELTNVFLKPFTTEVWQLIVAVGIFNWLSLYFCVKIEQYYDGREPVNTLDTHPASEIGLIAAASICQQGLSDGPRIYSGRIVFLFLFLWALLMFQFYSASVVGSLLIEKPRFINNAEDLLHSQLEQGAEDIAYNRDFFEVNDDPIVRKIFTTKMALNKKRTKLPYYPAAEGLKKVQQGGFAFQIDTATAYKFIEETFDENEICELGEVHLLPSSHTSTCVSKHSPFKKMVTYGLRLIMERGTSKRLNAIWNQRRPECPESHSTMPVPVMLQEFSPAIFLLLFGFGVSLSVMMLEKLIHHQREKRVISVVDAGN